MILIVGATGYLGGQIARGLLDRGRDVRVLVRPGSPYAPLVEAGAEPAIGDLKEPVSLERACAGVDTIVTTAISVMRRPPDTVETVELAGYASLFEAARRAGVQHVVYTSAAMADATSPVPFVAAKAVTEERLRASGMHWTILAPEAFMDVWLAMVVLGPALAGGEVVVVGSGTGRHQWVHSRDVAAFAIAAADGGEPLDRRLVVGGPSSCSLREAAAIVERRLGRPVPVRSVAPGDDVPGLPPMVAAMLGGFEVDSAAPQAEALAAEAGVRLTSVEDWISQAIPAAVPV